MDIGEYKLLCWRLDQVDSFFDDFAADHFYEADRARTGALVVCGFEIYRNKFMIPSNLSVVSGA